MTSKPSACSQSVYRVTHKDLPLSCPMDDMPVWNAHPKVFLPIGKTGTAVCPYCDAKFILIDFDPEQASDISDAEGNE